MVANPIAGAFKPYTVYALNTSRGITNIGCHPDNDIVIQGPGMQPFHLMLDHRQKPYRVIILTSDADVRLNGVRLAGSDPKEIADLNQLQFAGYAFHVQESNGSSSLEQVLILPQENGPAPSPTLTIPGLPFADPAPTSLPDGLVAPLPPAGLPLGLTLSEDTILVELAEPHLGVDVLQTAVLAVKVINGGPIVASFDISLEGVPCEWVEIFPGKLNLNEGSRANVEIRITPPRDPGTLAKSYPLQVNVVSSNYPGIYGNAPADLTVNSYAEFSIGNIFPRSQSASWNKKFAQASLPITNYGNSQAAYQISALDEENGCQFSFPTDGGKTSLVKQVEIRLDPGQAASVPIQITPLKRSLLRLQPRQYQYTVSAQPVLDPAAVRAVPGTFVSRPLFGLFSVVIAVILLAVGAYFLLRPQVNSFSVKDKIIHLGEPAVLQWNVSLFTTGIQIPGVVEPIKAGTNQISTVPVNTATTYILNASNWLSNMLRLDIHSQPISVLAIPTYPEIVTFFVDRTQIFEGDEITIKWSTLNAQEVLLTVEGVTESLKKEEFSGTRTVKIKQNSLVILEVKNNSGSVMRSEYIRALLPSARIVSFTVEPPTVIIGEPVNISWDVQGDGVETVTISPFADPLPSTGQLKFFPDASMEFVMTVKSRGDKQLQPELRSVGVLPAPGTPKINLFKLVPNKLSVPGTVELSWSVTGETTDIVLTSLDGKIAGNLPAQGFKSINVSKTTTLILTAYNGKLSDVLSQDIEVTTLKPVHTTILSLTPPASIRVGDKLTIKVMVQPVGPDGQPIDPQSLGYPAVSGNIQVTDELGNTCQIKLPLDQCDLQLNRIGVSTYLKAFFLGDGNYAQNASDPYKTTYEVIGNPAKMAIVISNLTPVIGESVKLSATITADTTNPSPPDVTGFLDVLQNGKVLAECSGIKIPTSTSVPGYGECFHRFTTTDLQTLEFLFRNSDTYQKLDNSVSLTVKKADTLVTFVNDLSKNTVTGEPLTVKVSVASALPGSGTPTGSVLIRDQANPYDDTCTAVLVNGTAICDAALNNGLVFHLSGSPKVIEARYLGDTNYNANDTTNTTHSVSPAFTSFTQFSISPVPLSAPISVGEQININVALAAAAPGSGTPTGDIHIAGADTTGTVIYTCTITGYPNQNNCTIPLTRSGGFTFSAAYSGSGNYQAVQSIYPSTYTINKAKTKTVLNSVTPAITGMNTDVVVNYTVSTDSTTTLLQPPSSINIKAWDINSPGVSNPACTFAAQLPSSCTLKLTVQGDRILQVDFPGNANFEASHSNPNDPIARVRVSKNSTTSLWTFQTNPVIGQEVTFFYSVTSSDGTPSPADISVTANYPTGGGPGYPTILPCGFLTNTSCKITFANAGSYDMIANYKGDALSEFAPSSFTISNFAVAKATTSVSQISIPGIPGSPPQIPAGTPFIVAFKVTNLNTSIIPSGKAYVNVSAFPTPSPTGTFTTLASDGSGSMQMSIPTSGTYYINVYFTDGPTNFIDGYSSLQVSVP